MTINSQDIILYSTLDENPVLICHLKTANTEEASTKRQLEVSCSQDHLFKWEEIEDLNRNNIIEEKEFIALINIYKIN